MGELTNGSDSATTDSSAHSQQDQPNDGDGSRVDLDEHAEEGDESSEEDLDQAFDAAADEASYDDDDSTDVDLDQAFDAAADESDWDSEGAVTEAQLGSEESTSTKKDPESAAATESKQTVLCDRTAAGTLGVQLSAPRPLAAHALPPGRGRPTALPQRSPDAPGAQSGQSERPGDSDILLGWRDLPGREHRPTRAC